MGEQLRQNHPDEYHYHLQRFIDTGKITPKNLEIIRAKNNKLGNDIYVSDTNSLIKELDTKIYRVMSGT